MIKTQIITFEDYHRKSDIGSSRIRGFNLAKLWKEAGEDIGECSRYIMGQKSDVVIYQKAYWLEHARNFKGLKILDMCDPDFLHWGYPIQEMIQLIDVITVSSPELLNALKIMTDKPVYLVNDGILLDDHVPVKIHRGPAKSVVWYGYAENFPLLDGCMSAISKFDLNLIVVSSKSYIINNPIYSKIKLTNLPWSANWKKDLLKGDIVLNPVMKMGRWKYKSNNKTTQAWALGLPVATNEKELESFLIEENRIKEIEIRFKEVQENYSTEKSIIQMKEIIKKHYDSTTRTA